jgi:hypothetical protein
MVESPKRSAVNALLTTLGLIPDLIREIQAPGSGVLRDRKSLQH